MKNFQVFLGLAVVIFLCCVTLKVYALGSTCDYECNTGSCGGSLHLSDGNEPRPEGCTQDGTDCAGSCYRNQNSTATYWCQYAAGETCYWQPADKTLSCGDRYEYDCGGTWANDCSCPTTGGEDTEEDGVATKCVDT